MEERDEFLEYCDNNPLNELEPLDDEGEEIYAETCVLAKNDLIALLCLKTAEGGGAILRFDPREIKPALQVYDSEAKAIDIFWKSIRTSINNGWKVVHKGQPNYD